MMNLMHYVFNCDHVINNCLKYIKYNYNVYLKIDKKFINKLVY